MPFWKMAIYGLILSISGAVLNAGVVGYSYAGNAFKIFSPGGPHHGFVDTSSFILGTITFPATLPPNLNLVDERGYVLSYYFTDGFHVCSNPNFCGLIELLLSTDANGNIVGEWSVEVQLGSIQAL